MEQTEEYDLFFFFLGSQDKRKRGWIDNPGKSGLPRTEISRKKDQGRAGDASFEGAPNVVAGRRHS